MFARSPLGGALFRARPCAAARRIACTLLAAALLAGNPAAAPIEVEFGPSRLAGAGVASSAPAVAAFVLPAEGAGLLLAAERGKSPAHGTGSGGADAVLPPRRTVAAMPAARCRRRLARQRGAARPAHAFSPRAPPLQA